MRHCVVVVDHLTGEKNEHFKNISHSFQKIVLSAPMEMLRGEERPTHIKALKEAASTPPQDWLCALHARPGCWQIRPCPSPPACPRPVPGCCRDQGGVVGRAETCSLQAR